MSTILPPTAANSRGLGGLTLQTNVRWGRILPTLLMLVVCGYACWRPVIAYAQLPLAELYNLSRSGGQVGSEFELRTVSGVNLDEVTSLRWSDPRIESTLLTDDPLPWTEERLPRFGNFLIRLPDDLPPGRYEVRTVGRHGVSNSRAFLASRLPDLFPEQNSRSRDAPVALPRDVRLHGQTNVTATDYFALQLAAGRRIRIDLLAQQLESRLIGQLSLISPTGQVVASVRGADDVDPRLVVAIEQDGDYLLAVRDFLYRGGDDYYYQLCLQDDARAIEHIAAAAELLEGHRFPGRVPPRWHPSALILADDGRRFAEPVQTIDDAAQAPSLSVGCRVVGVFDTDNPEDEYSLEIREQEDVAVEVFSQRLGEPTDSIVWIERRQDSSAEGMAWDAVAASDDSQTGGDPVVRVSSRDPLAVFTPSKLGTYRVRLRDLDAGEGLGVRQNYWLDVRQARPDFSLVAYRPCPVVDVSQSRPIGTHLWRGGAEAIRVVAVRRDGWTGPIEASVANLPEGVACAPATIAANQTEVQLTLAADPEAPAWIGALQVVGRGVYRGEVYERPAVAATIARGPGGTRGFVRSRLATELILSVSDVDTSPLFVELGNGEPLQARRGTTASLPIKLTRRDGGREGFLIRARNMPPGVEGADVMIPAEANESKIDLVVPAAAVPGRYSMWLQAEVPLTFKPNPQALQRAEQYRASLAARLDEATEESDREAIEAAIQVADQRIETAKARAQDQRLIVHVPSSHAAIEIVE